MTVKSFGEIMPLQGFMLMLAGYGASNSDGGADLILADEDEKYIENMIEGFRRLRIRYPSTALDCRLSLRGWHRRLLDGSDSEKVYKFGFAWPDVEEGIVAQILNPRRGILEKEAESIFF